MSLSKKTVNNHFIPCFWSAFWNLEYLNGHRHSLTKKGKPRKQVLHLFKIKQQISLTTIAEKCFVEKNLYNTDFFHENIVTYIKENFPANYKFPEDLTDEDVGITFDIENIFSVLESTCVSSLFETIKTGKIEDLGTKTYLSVFIFLQMVRTPVLWHYLFGVSGTPKDELNEFEKLENRFRLLYQFRKSFESHESIFNAIGPFLSSKWVLYRTRRPIFPVSDHTVLFNNGKFLVALSPDLMIEILFRKKILPSATPCKHRSGYNFLKYKTFKRTLVNQAEREIVFCYDNQYTSWSKALKYRNPEATILLKLFGKFK